MMLLERRNMAATNPLLNRAYAAAVATAVCDAAVASLMRQKSGMTDDLESLWEEICVQVQGEETGFWDAYELAMRDSVAGILQYISREATNVMWLQTDAGWDLRYDMEADEESGEAARPGYVPPEVIADERDIVSWIVKEYLRPNAMNFSSERVDRYLCQSDDTTDDAFVDSGEVAAPTAPSIPEVEMIDYWRSDSGNRYFTCLNHWYIFEADINQESPEWRLVNNDYSRWDSIHQGIYRNFRMDSIRKEDIPAILLPAPESIPPEALNPPPPPPPEPILCSDYPLIADYLAKCDGASMAIYVVLVEDTYESLNGDGEFHYVEAAFLDLPSAKRFRPDGSEFYRYHARPGLIWLDGEEIGYEVPRRIFDHIYRDQVLKLVSQRIESKVRPSKSTRKKPAMMQGQATSGDLF